MEPQPINYKNKKTKAKPLTTRRKIVLVVLLASLSLNAYQLGKKVVDNIHDDIVYSQDNKIYTELIRENTHRTQDGKNYFYDHYDIAKTLRTMSIKDKDDFYHNLIKIAKNFATNKQTNFEDLITALNLDEIAFSDPRYPTNKELRNFMETQGFYREDGSIDFEEWLEYDKKVINFEYDMQKEAEERKGK